MVACDFFVSVTAIFCVLYVFVALEIGSRRIVHWNLTEHPTSAWTLQRFRELSTIPTDPCFTTATAFLRGRLWCACGEYSCRNKPRPTVSAPPPGKPSRFVDTRISHLRPLPLRVAIRPILVKASCCPRGVLSSHRSTPLTASIGRRAKDEERRCARVDGASYRKAENWAANTSNEEAPHDVMTFCSTGLPGGRFVEPLPPAPFADYLTTSTARSSVIPMATLSPAFN
jgi:hypothetical protein